MSARWDRQFRVDVWFPNFATRIGTLAQYQQVAVTWQRLGVGTASITVPERGRAALQMLQAAQSLVPITITAPGLPRWSGRVVPFEATKDSGKPGVITVTAVGDAKWLQKILAAPVPGSPWSAQSAAEHDVRTGPVVTVAKGYIADNLARLAAEGRPTPLAVAGTVGPDTSPTVTVKARFSTLADLLDPPLRQHGYDITTDMWLPGDPQPFGLTLTAPTVVVDVVPGRNRPWVRFTDTAGAVKSRTVNGTHPAALAVVLGGPGEGTARVVQKVVTSDPVVAAIGRWAYPEEWLDATDADTPELRTQRGQEKLTELAGTAAVQVELTDRRPWQAGPDGDYWVNDVIRAEFSGVTVEDRIDRVVASDSKEGTKVGAHFGQSRATESPEKRVVALIATLRTRLAVMEQRR